MVVDYCIKEKMVSIYALYDPRQPSLIRYVGKTETTINNRLLNHISEARTLKTNTHKCNWIRSLLKDGVSPCASLLMEVPESEWQQWECQQIAFYKDEGHSLTNSTLGGDGVVATPEIRKKISDAHKGKVVSAATREKMRQVNTGKILTDEHKASISKGSLGRVVTQETRDKISKAHTGKKLDAQELENIRSKRKPVSDETKEKQRNAKLGKKIPKESIEKREATNRRNRELKRLKKLQQAEDEARVHASLEDGFSVWIC